MDNSASNLFIASWHWLRSWFIGSGVSRQLFMVDRRLDLLERNRNQVVTQLKKQERDLRRIHSAFQSEWESAWQSAESDMESSRSLIKQYEAEIEALRIQIQIRDDLTIPGLTNNFKVIEAQNHAMIAMETQRRQTALDGSIRNTA